MTRTGDPRAGDRSWPAPVDRTVDEELALHLELQTRRFIAQGLDPAAARTEALRRFGDVERVRDECREIGHRMEAEMRRAELRQEAKQDVAYALRVLRKNPIFTAIALITLAIGIGANTAIFSVLHAVLLRALPYRHAEQVVAIWNTYEQAGMERTAIAPAEFADIQEQNRSFSAVSAISRQYSNLTGDGEPERVMAYAVSPNLFDVLGATPLLGRTFVADDGREGSERVVVLTHALWTRRFGSDSSLVGRQVDLNGRRRTVVGVMPPGVRFPDAPVEFLVDRADLWIPFAWEQARSESRGNQYLGLVARLRPGATEVDVRADLERIARGFRAEFPDRYTEESRWSIGSVPLREQMVGQVRRALVVMAAAVGLVLLIACANVANLTLARGAIRRRELAIRTALGAVTGLLFGLAPALQQSRADTHAIMKEGGRAAGEGRSGKRFRSSLVIAEVAMALVVLVGAGLLLRSFARLQEVNPGFDGDRVMSFQLTLPRAKYDSAAKVAGFYRQLVERVTEVPGADEVGAVYPLPMAGEGWGGSYVVDGQPIAPGQPEPHAEYAVSMPGYFRTMRIRLLAGRDFTMQDAAGAPEVVVVDEELARRHWPGENAVGKRINLIGRGEGVYSTVVGVVGHVRSVGPHEEGEPQIYMPFLQRPQAPLALVTRGPMQPTALAIPLRQQVRALDHDLPIARMQPVPQIVSRAVARQRLNMTLLAIFAGAALVLAGIGLYGVMSYTVAQRVREIGIRLALGGRPSHVLALVVREGMGIALIGLALGIVASFALSRLVAGLLFGIAPTDPLTYAAISALLVMVALVASYLPARRATRVDPSEAIRTT